MWPGFDSDSTTYLLCDLLSGKYLPSHVHNEESNNMYLMGLREEKSSQYRCKTRSDAWNAHNKG